MNNPIKMPQGCIPMIAICERCSRPIFADEYNETVDMLGICDECLGRDEHEEWERDYGMDDEWDDEWDDAR